MPAPTSSVQPRPEIAQSLIEFDLAMDRNGFVGHRVFPVFEAPKDHGTFGKIPIEQLLQNRETARAPKGGYSRGNYTFTSDTFTTAEHGAEEPVDDREKAMYSDYFNADLYASQRAMDVVLRNAEKRIAAAVFNTSTWTGSSLTTAVSTEWSTAATSTPINDVEGAVRKVRTNTGLKPNTIIMPWTVFRNLRLCSQIIDRITSSGAGSPAKPTDITPAMLAAVFDIESVLVADSQKNTATEGQSASLSDIWSNEYVMVCRVARTQDLAEPCIGRTFHWGEDGSRIGGTVESYREEDIRSDVMRVRHQVGEKVLYAECGHLLSNITA